MQIKVDEKNLDNGTWRKLFGDISIVNTSNNSDWGSKKVVSCSFKIFGDTPGELNSRWQTTYDDFQLRDPRVLVWADDSATNPTDDIGSGDGQHDNVSTSVSWDGNFQQTSRSLVCNFICVADVRSTQSGRIGERGTFEGLEGNIELMTNYNAAGITSRTLRALFVPTFDDAAYGPFTCTDVDSNGGYARFLLTSAPPTYNAAAGQRILLAGTANYDGWLEITGITGNYVTTSRPIIIPETGLTASAYIGAVADGEDNYLAAKSDLLEDYLLVEADGGYNATEGLALTNEAINESIGNKGSVDVTLTADFMTDEFITGTRAFEIVIGKKEQDAYDRKGGLTTILYTAKGHFTVDADTGPMSTLFNLAQGRIKSIVENRTGSTIRTISRNIVLDPQTYTVNFEMTFHSMENLIAYNLTTTFNDQDLWTSYRDSDGYDLIQEPVNAVKTRAIVTVERSAYSKGDLSSDIGPPLGGTWKRLSLSKVVDNDKVTINGDIVYHEVWTAVYEKIKVRGGVAQGRSGGASQSTGVFTGGYFGPSGPDV